MLLVVVAAAEALVQELVLVQVLVAVAAHSSWRRRLPMQSAVSTTSDCASS